ncbi:hypothetical protein GDO81_018679 [Engystomops pustulosus]|uniref:Uncharacterized protein n=1 Tax=Engystomops pustulosus TaxID=76066 RepID=A0AAV6ZJ20_ENGPU|nr:hypothetical protein GDO81_018679 [Engystomops pustulosus]
MTKRTTKPTASPTLRRLRPHCHWRLRPLARGSPCSGMERSHRVTCSRGQAASGCMYIVMSSGDGGGGGCIGTLYSSAGQRDLGGVTYLEQCACADTTLQGCI